MACLDGISNFVCPSPATKALTFPSSNGISRSRLGFFSCDERKSRIQNSVKHQFETVAFPKVEVDHPKSDGSETFIFIRCSRHTGRARHCAGSRQSALLTSWFWLAPQGVVDKPLKQFSSTKRLVSCHVCGPSLSPDDGEPEPDIDRGTIAQRVNAAAANVPLVSAKIWQKEGKCIRSSDCTSGSSSGAHGKELTADRFVNVDFWQSEAEFDAGVVNHFGSTRSLHSVDASSHNSSDPAIFRLEGDRLPHERGDLWQAAEKQVVSNSLRSSSVSQLGRSRQESPISSADAEELAGKTLGFTGGAAADILEVIEGARPLTLIDQVDNNSQFADPDSGTCEHRHRDATRTAPQAAGFWKIVNNDIEFLARNFNWAKEVALPVLADRARKVLWLRLWEDESIVPVFETPCPKDYYSELSGKELLAADAQFLKGYIHSTLSWLRGWRIPLNPVYEPELIAEYFNRRPHVLLFRVLQVSAVFGSVIIQLEIEKVLNTNQGPAKPITGNEVQGNNRWPELLKEALVKLGPTFIKVGQSLSTRPDLVGAEMAKILAELQDSLPPFPTPQAMTIIEREFGQPLNEVFSYLSEKPVAAASFGQVYKGRTPNGQEVAVKVQRPNLLCLVALDIYILRMALAAIRKIAKRRNDLRRYADELGLGLFGELDYMQEGANAAEFQAAHSKLTFLEVPKIITSLSTRRVLTMEWMDGDRPLDLLLTASRWDPDGDVYLREEQMKAKQRLFSLINKGVEASLVQLLDTGILHADPHPGNLLYTQNDQMVLLDFGLLCRMEKKHQLAMIASVAHIVNAEWKNFVDDLADMEVLPHDIDRAAIALELERALIDVVPKAGVPDIKFSKVLVKVLAIAIKHQFKMPPYFILVLRSIASLEGLALAVDPDFKVFAASYPFVLQRLLTDKSARLRNVFISLVLNERKEFRWDRLASFATLARQHKMQRLALEAGMKIQNMAASDENDAKSTISDLVPLLVNLLASKDGVILWRLILEADTPALALAFNSSKAAVFRRHVATAMANTFYQSGQNVLKKHTNIMLQDSLETSQSSPLLSKEQLQESSSLSETSLETEVKLSSICSDTLDGSLLKSRRLRFLLRTAMARLRKMPLLLLNTGWTCFSMFCYAIFIAAQRLVVAVLNRYLQSNPGTKQRSDNELILARA